MIDSASIIVKNILNEKTKLENSGKKPKVILICKTLFEILEKNWFWKEDTNLLYGIPIICVETVDNFEVR